MTPEDEALRREELARGTRAETILNDELVKAAFQQLRDDAVKAFKNATPDDAEALRIARLQYDVTESLLGSFAKHLQKGKMAAAQLSAWDKLRSKVTRRAA